jgi:hypothetical protein
VKRGRSCEDGQIFRHNLTGHDDACEARARAWFRGRRYAPVNPIEGLDWHCHINRFYCSLLGCPLDSDSINSMLSASATSGARAFSC